MAYVEFEKVKKTYQMGEVSIEALKDATFEIEKGEICVIVGASGAGKTTLLNILGGMDSLTSGRVTLDGEEISSYNSMQLTTYRRYDVGFVFQFYNLVQNLTAIENVELAAQICKNPMDAARALAKNPKLMLCDEPTGALDYNTGKAVLQLLQDCSRENGMTVVIITHNQALTAMADRVVSVKSGVVTDVTRNEHPIPIEDIEW